MRFFVKALQVMLLGMWFGGFVQAQEKTLHVYNWSDYIGENTLADFTKKTGIKVVYDVFDTNEVLEAKLLSGRSGYDLVVPSNAFLAKQIKAGVFQKLDKSRLPNWKNLDATLLKKLEVSDPGNQYGVPYLWGTVGIGYNQEKIKAAFGDSPPPEGWDLLFKPENIAKLKDCGVALLDSPTEIIPTALHYLGYPIDSSDKAQLKKAEELLLSIRPYIAYFHSSKYISDLANGNICLAVGYSGDIYQAKSRAADAHNGVKIGYRVPKEGAGAFFDMLAIPADAANGDAAHQFINYLMDPQVIASITNSVQFPNANQAAATKVKDSLRSDPGVYPTPEVLGKLYAFPDLPPKTQRALTRMWTQIRSGQ